MADLFDTGRVLPLGRLLVYRNLQVKTLPAAWQCATKPKSPVKGRDGRSRQWADLWVRGVTFRESPTSHRRCYAAVCDPHDKHGWDVHAYAEGEVFEDRAVFDREASGVAVAITYDKGTPGKPGCGRFVRKDTGRVIVACQWVHFASDGHSYAYGAITEEG